MTRKLDTMFYRFLYALVNGTEKNLVEEIEAIANYAEKNRGIREIIRFVRENDLAVIFYKYIDLFSDNKLHRYIKALYEYNQRRRIYRDQLLEVTTSLLEDHGIEYVVFKTFSNLGVIDVDIDLLINIRDYPRTVDLFIRNGYIAIDDITKTYATGFLYKQNPIVLDLHTSITVLGIPYISSELLLENRKKINVYSEYSDAEITLYTTSDEAEAIVRIAHAIIKEAEIKIDDLVAFAKTANKIDKLLPLIRREGLLEAYCIFLYASAPFLQRNTELFEPCTKRIVLAQAKTCIVTPLKLGRLPAITAILARLIAVNQPYYLLRAIINLKYKRNSAHIGHLVLKRIFG